jgi:sensor histidine kinase YesM
MRASIAKYHLKEGILIAVIFPAMFIISDSNATNIFSRFVSSFLMIFSLWMINFTIIDFTNPKPGVAKKENLNIYWRLTASFILSLVIYISVGLLFDRAGNMISSVRGNWGNSISSWVYLFLKIFLFNTLIILVKYAYDSNAEKRRIELENEVLKRENLNAMHETLKQQVNPHFLFNSLNTLKSLTKNNPDQAVKFIGELASVYRYMLIHQDKKVVTLGEELDFMRSYLYLLKIRFGEAICTDTQVPDSVLENTMPPNTLQLLIENAVKHNALSIGKPLHISIFVREGYLTVQNNLRAKSVLPASSQLGLNNISSRYLLLKGKDIVIRKIDNNFLVQLPII